MLPAGRTPCLLSQPSEPAAVPLRRPPLCVCAAQQGRRERARAPGSSTNSSSGRAAPQQLDRDAVQRASAADASFRVHTVQWYPGHIAKAERQLREQLKMVDVVLEVRDARIPQSTCHPQVPMWIGSKPRLVVINRQDMVSRSDRAAWDGHFSAEAAAAEAEGARKAAAARLRTEAAQAAGAEQPDGAPPVEQQQQDGGGGGKLAPPSLPRQVFWTDGKAGAGVHALRRAALRLGDHINAKRALRGLTPRPVRACVIGFPNIGKSALINRLLERRVVESAARPGVTRVLRWVRLGSGLDLLDAPGIIPASFNDQAAAQALAICNDIGSASYVDSLIAAAMLIRIKALPRPRAPLAALARRYGLHPLEASAEEFVAHVAGRLFGGDREQAGARLLGDYRNGALGAFALELPPPAAPQAGAGP